MKNQVTTSLSTLLWESIRLGFYKQKQYLKIKLKHNSNTKTPNQMIAGCHNTQHVRVSSLGSVPTSEYLPNYFEVLCPFLFFCTVVTLSNISLSPST